MHSFPSLYLRDLVPTLAAKRHCDDPDSVRGPRVVMVLYVGRYEGILWGAVICCVHTAVSLALTRFDGQNEIPVYYTLWSRGLVDVFSLTMQFVMF